MRTLLKLVLSLGLAGPVGGQVSIVPSVTVQDTLPGGSTFSGQVTIAWPTFVLRGALVTAASQSVQVTNGALTVKLWPSEQALVLTEGGQLIHSFVYTVTAPISGHSYVDHWFIPASAANTTVTIAALKSVPSLGSTPANCSAGSFPTGINSAGDAQNCTKGFLESGAAFTNTNIFYSTASSFLQNTSVLCLMKGEILSQYPTSWLLRMR